MQNLALLSEVQYLAQTLHGARPMLIRTTKELGALVRDRRMALGWTLDDLAMRTPMSRRWVADVESGKSGVALGPVLSLLAALGLTLDSKISDLSGDHELDAHLRGLEASEGP